MNSFRSRRKGFTLIEILLVIALLAFLGTVSVVSLQKVRRQADKDSTQLLVNNTASAVEMYQVHMNAVPEDDDGLTALIEKPDDESDAEKWAGPYLKPAQIPLDSWGNELKYEKIDRDEDDYGPEFKVFSYGPDGDEGTDDDIASHKEKE